MRIAQKIDVLACDRRDCEARWCSAGGKTFTTLSYQDARHTSCEVLEAVFCSRDCHRHAHADEAHGLDWRRKRAPKLPKRALFRRVP